MEENRTCFCPEGMVTVSRAGGLKEEIISNLGGEDFLVIDLSRVTHIDLSFIQLLFAVKKEADLRQKKISFAGMDSGPVKDALLKAGCDEKYFSEQPAGLKG